MKKRMNQTAEYLRAPSWHADDSVAAQLKTIRRYAGQRGLKIVQVATDGES